MLYRIWIKLLFNLRQQLTFKNILKILFLLSLLIIFLIYRESVYKFLSYSNLKVLYADYWVPTVGSLAVCLTFLAIWWIPKYQIRSLNWRKNNLTPAQFEMEKERITLRDETRKTLAQVIGGIFFVFGLFVTYNTFELNRQGQELSREGQVTERYSKAVELIGSADLSVRLGGLYALERIAKDSHRDHSTVMEILGAYIREKSRQQKEQTDKDNLNKDKEIPANKTAPKQYTIKRSPTDVVAAINIINRRELKNDKAEFAFDFSYANFNEVILDHAKFHGANFYNAWLNKTGFFRANLIYANFAYATLNNATLTAAELNCANFSNAKLINAVFTDAVLTDSNFSGADLTDSTGLTLENLRETFINDQTTLPAQFEPQKTELVNNSKIRVSPCLNK